MSRNVSLNELSRRTHYSKGYLSKVENGLSPFSEEMARQCDGALGTDGALLSVAKARTATDQRHRKVTDTDDHEGHWVLQMDDDGSVWFQPVARRAALTIGATSLLALHAGTNATPGRQRPEAALPIFADFFGQLRQLGQQVAPEFVLPTVIAQTHAIQRIAATSTGRVRCSSFGLAARYAEYAGWMAQEAGQDTAALWWTDRAVLLAAEGDDTELAAYSLVRQALVALYAGDALQTVELARRAQQHTGASPRVRGLAAQREAQGLALAGSSTDCMRALDRANVLLDTGPPSDGQLVLGSSTVRNPVALTTAWCLHDLGRSEEAADQLEAALRDSPPAARRFNARWRVRQALALATSRQIEQACQRTTQLLPDLAAINSATIRSDVVALARTLSRWLSHPQVRELYPALTAVLHTGPVPTT